jgi:uncharacterized protein YlxW (UPF0749 family)
MLAIGLLLILVAAAVTVGFIYDGGHDGKFDVFGQHITLNTPGAFLTGVLTMLVFLVGIWMLISSMGRSRRKRAERKQTKARQRESVSKIEEERAQLRAENERLQEKLARDTRPASTTGATSGAAGTGAHAAPDETSSDTTGRAGSTDAGTTGATVVGSDQTHVDGSAASSDRPSDLTSREEPATSTSGRPREEI